MLAIPLTMEDVAAVRVSGMLGRQHLGGLCVGPSSCNNCGLCRASSCSSTWLQDESLPGVESLSGLSMSQAALLSRFL